MQAAFALPAPVNLPSVALPNPEPTPSAPAVTLPPEPAPPLAAPAPLILFGRDDRGRPHASRFAGHETAAVERAAGMMALSFIAAETDALRELAARLPAGRLFGSGRAFVPFVAAALYDRLLATIGTPDQPRPAALPVRAAAKAAEAGGGTGAGAGSPATPGSPGEPAGSAPQRPSDWAGIGRGSHVLACQGPMEGWFEAVVLYTKSPDSFVLRWRDWPGEPEIVRARKDLGLLPVNSREGMA